MDKAKEVFTIVFVALALGLIFHVVFNEGIDKMNKMPVKSLQYQMERSN